MPGNVFPDLYRDIIYPGGIYNAGSRPGSSRAASSWSGCRRRPEGRHRPAVRRRPWLSRRCRTRSRPLDTRAAPLPRRLLGARPGHADRPRPHPDPRLRQLAGHHGPEPLVQRVPRELRSADDVGGRRRRARTTDCPISRARRVRFLDRYLKGADNGWERTPRLVLVHERDREARARQGARRRRRLAELASRRWKDVDARHPPAAALPARGRAPRPRAGGEAGAAPTPTATAPDREHAGRTSAATARWNRPTVPGRPADLHDARGWPATRSSSAAAARTSGSPRPRPTPTSRSRSASSGPTARSSSSPTAGCGCRTASSRRRDRAGCARCTPTCRRMRSRSSRTCPSSRASRCSPSTTCSARGSAIRLSIDTPGGWFPVVPGPATNTVHHRPGMASALVLGRLPGGRARAPQPPCERCSTSRAGRRRAGARGLIHDEA